MKITDEDRQRWRSGLHAANPEQARIMVREIDVLRDALWRLCGRALIGACSDTDPVLVKARRALDGVKP